MTTTNGTEATIEADPAVPAIHTTRDFNATTEQLMRAHLDPEIFVKWVGPHGTSTEVKEWDATRGGRWRYGGVSEGQEYWFFGSFHDVGDNRIVQTFTWEGLPEAVSLETMRFEDLGDGRTRLHATSLCPSFEERDGWLKSGMEVGVNDGYAKLGALLADGAI